MSCFTVLMEVMRERVAQQDKWGEQNHPWLVGGHHWGNFHTADQARDMVNTLAAHPRQELDYAGILTEEFHEALEAEDDDIRTELIQVAAVAVAAIESLDRNGR